MIQPKILKNGADIKKNQIITKEEFSKIKKERDNIVNDIKEKFGQQFKIYISDLIRDAVTNGHNKIIISEDNDTTKEIYKKTPHKDSIYRPGAQWDWKKDRFDIIFHSTIENIATEMDFPKPLKNINSNGIPVFRIYFSEDDSYKKYSNPDNNTDINNDFDLDSDLECEPECETECETECDTE